MTNAQEIHLFIKEIILPFLFILLGIALLGWALLLLKETIQEQKKK